MPKGELHVELTVNYADDPKLAEVSRLARLLYVDALCKSKLLLNDGVLTVSQVERLAYPDSKASARRQAQELVGSGAWSWDESTRTYTVTGWLKRNRSRAKVEADRTAAAEEQGRKGREGNHKRWHVDRGVTDPQCEICASPEDRQLRSGKDRVGIPNDRSETETETETEKNLAKAARGTHAPRSNGQKRADELNATSRRADTQRLLNAWETQRGSTLLADARRQWTRAIDQVLDEGADERSVTDALPVLAARGLGPSLLASVIEEQRGKRAARPIHERGPDEVTDAELTRQALDTLLGDDSWMPAAPPREVEDGPPEQRAAWYAEQTAGRLAQRRAEARRVLARNNGTPA